MAGSSAADTGATLSASLREIEECHLTALAEGKETYEDPRTGYVVFTSSFLKTRRKCCGSQCRHCPFGHQKVKGHQCTPETCPFQVGVLRNALAEPTSTP